MSETWLVSREDSAWVRYFATEPAARGFIRAELAVRPMGSLTLSRGVARFAVDIPPPTETALT